MIQILYKNLNPFCTAPGAAKELLHKFTPQYIALNTGGCYKVRHVFASRQPGSSRVGSTTSRVYPFFY